MSGWVMTGIVPLPCAQPFPSRRSASLRSKSPVFPRGPASVPSPFRFERSLSARSDAGADWPQRVHAAQTQVRERSWAEGLVCTEPYSRLFTGVRNE